MKIDLFDIGPATNNAVRGLKRMCEAIETDQVPVCKELQEVNFNSFIESVERLQKAALKWCKELIDTMTLHYPYKRVVHLAKYGHGRTKKKNINRLKKDILRRTKK